MVDDPRAAAAAVPVLWDMSSWWIDTPKGWLPDLTIYVYYLGFFLAGALLFRHRDLLPGIGKRWPLQLVIGNLIVLPLMLKLTISGNWAEESARGLPAWLVGWKAGAIFLGGLYTWLMLSALLGIFQRYFAGSAGWWKCLADYVILVFAGCDPAAASVAQPCRSSLAPARQCVTFTLLLVSYELCPAIRG